MEEIQNKINTTSAFLKERGFSNGKVAIVLGTGLTSFLEKLKTEKEMYYTDIPNFPVSTVEFHKGQLLIGTVNGVRTIIMQGRFHYYEGYSMQELTFPIRVLKALGVEYLFLSNAAGGLNISYNKGNLVVIDDHINMLPDNPLRGLNDKSFGNRFVDMSCPYDTKLNDLLFSTAKHLNIPVKKGIYVSVMGPNLETRAEYRYLKQAGADMVGMSTVPEVIVANHIGLPCAAISVITDECDPDNLQPVSIKEIIEVAAKADIILTTILEQAIGTL